MNAEERDTALEALLIEIHGKHAPKVFPEREKWLPLLHEHADKVLQSKPVVSSSNIKWADGRQDTRAADVTAALALKVKLAELEGVELPAPAPVVEPEVKVESSPKPRRASRLPSTPEAQAAEDARLVAKTHRMRTDLVPHMPHILFNAYFVCFDLANWTTGQFHITETQMSEALGSTGRKTGQRVLAFLEAARLIKTLVQGAKGHATVYRLLPLGHTNRHVIVAALHTTWWGKNPGMRSRKNGNQHQQEIA